MKIGLDLRFIGDNIYSRFVLKLVENIIKEQKNNDFIIYTNSELNFKNFENCKIKNVNIALGSLAEQSKFKKILKNDNLGLAIFFNHYKPVFYKGDYLIFIGDLKDLFYSDFKNHFQKYKFLYLMSKNVSKANKIICLDKITKSELIERFNISEKKIEIVDGFFPFKELKKPFVEDDETKIEVSIKTKYNIKNDYFLYSAGDSIEKNYEKLIKVFKRLKNDGFDIDLVFLGNNIGKNISLRNLILENKLQENIFFIGSPEINEKKLIYENSLGTIFPSLYEPFPFRLTEPIYFNSPILSSNLKKIENIFGDKINYFSPISVNSIYLEIKKFLSQDKKSANYSDIKNIYTIENTTKQILKIID